LKSPLQIDVERAEDGRILASVPELPEVMAYGDTEDSALRKAKAIALPVLADTVENGEELPQPPSGRAGRCPAPRPRPQSARGPSSRWTSPPTFG